MTDSQEKTADTSALLIQNQLCFPLYACSKEVVKRYTPLLDKLDLTYTQYIAMMVLWDKHQISCKELGQILYLDSGTITPLIKRLKAKGFVTTERLPEDERIVIVTITDEGMALRDKALSVPSQMTSCISLEPEEAIELYRLLYKVLDGFETKDEIDDKEK